MRAYVCSASAVCDTAVFGQPRLTVPISSRAKLSVYGGFTGTAVIYSAGGGGGSNGDTGMLIC